MASSSFRRWVRPEIYPLMVPIVAVVGLCGFQLIDQEHHLQGSNPDVRVTKANRAAGVLENFEEGERYRENAVRRFVRTQPREVMPSINKFFSDRSQLKS